MKLGKYEYGKASLALSTGLFIAGAIYAIATHKPPLTIFLLALVGSLMGAGISIIIYPPKRIAE